MDEVRTVPLLLRDARKKSRLLQHDLAALVGHGQPHLSAIETGAVQPTLATVSLWIRCCASACLGRGEAETGTTLLAELPWLREEMERLGLEARA